jgi:hypothetical protein
VNPVTTLSINLSELARPCPTDRFGFVMKRALRRSMPNIAVQNGGRPHFFRPAGSSRKGLPRAERPTRRRQDEDLALRFHCRAKVGVRGVAPIVKAVDEDGIRYDRHRRERAASLRSYFLRAEVSVFPLSNVRRV